MSGAVWIGVRALVHVVRRAAAFLVVHLAGLYRVRRREPAAVGELHARLGAETAHAPAARVGQAAQRLPIEEISWPAGQAGFDRCGRLRSDHVQQLEVRALRLELRRLARHDQHARAFLGRVRLALELDAVARSLHHIDQVIVLARVDRELPALEDRSPVDGQVLRAAEARAANLPFEPRLDRNGLGFVRVDDGNVFDGSA